MYLQVGMIAAYAMEALSSFHLISFYYIFIIPSPSPINVNIITQTNIIIGFVTRKILVVTVLSRTFFQSNSKSLDQVSDEKKIKIKIFQSIKPYESHPDINCLPLLSSPLPSYYQRDQIVILYSC